MIRRPPGSTLFPYTTLFRSVNTVPSTCTVTLPASTRNTRCALGVTEKRALPESRRSVISSALDTTGSSRAFEERATTSEPSAKWSSGCGARGATVASAGSAGSDVQRLPTSTTTRETTAASATTRAPRRRRRESSDRSTRARTRRSRSGPQLGWTCCFSSASRETMSAIGERLLDHQAGREDAALGGSERAAAQRGHALERLALDVAERPGNPLVRGHPFEDTVHPREQGPLLGRRPDIRHALVDSRLVETDQAPQAALSEPRSRCAHGHPREPSFDGSRVTQLAHSAYRREEHLLDRIVDVVVPAEESVRDGRDVRRVAPEQRVQIEPLEGRLGGVVVRRKRNDAQGGFSARHTAP